MIESTEEPRPPQSPPPLIVVLRYFLRHQTAKLKRAREEIQAAAVEGQPAAGSGDGVKVGAGEPLEGDSADDDLESIKRSVKAELFEVEEQLKGLQERVAKMRRGTYEALAMAEPKPKQRPPPWKQTVPIGAKKGVRIVWHKGFSSDSELGSP